MTVLSGQLVLLRPYRETDAVAVQQMADDPLVAQWMTHHFPHPYTFADAERWIAFAIGAGPPVNHFAIEVDGRYAGGIGIIPRDGEQAGTATFGYWLGRPFWGRGIATDAARTLATHALNERALRRLEASVFAPNVPSMRVLEKAGFDREGLLRHAYVGRDGRAYDAVVYGSVAIR